MSFIGHKLIKINRDYVFDLTSCSGYKVFKKRGNIIGYKLAYEIQLVMTAPEGKYKVIYHDNDTPFGIVRKSCILLGHKKDILDGKYSNRKSR